MLVSQRAVGGSTAWSAAVTRAIALSPAFAGSVAVSLALATTPVLGSSGPVAVVVSVCLLAFCLTGRAFFLGLRRSAVSAAAAARSALGKSGAGGQQGDGNPSCDVFRFHDLGWFGFQLELPRSGAFLLE